ncbi:oxidoreductase [Paenibacillus alkalitolerans]|uniref:oxidoreductase n=1 Tax=Paenibacillus alkalitolerans TaxID=2799335 RepID=UPI0018F5038E|nr:NADH:flavin oxidoreductase [Paenibacillus alkalitolerans]
MSSYPQLLSAFRLGSSFQLPNRAVLSPMTRTSAEPSGMANERMVRYYTRFAKGGFGLIITEGLYPDDAYSQSYDNQPGIANDAQAESWIPVIRAVQREGAKIIAQLIHAGALVQHGRFAPIAPSAVKPVGAMLEEHGGSGEFPVPREMSQTEIRQAVEGFAQAALRAKRAGFDGVEVHAANGYLLDQFITDYTNLRTDEYGGSTERRIRIVAEVLEAIRAAVGPDYIVGVRISQGKVNDFHHKWAGGEADANIIFERVAAASPSYIHTTEYKAFAPAFSEGGPTLAGLAKRYSGLPVIANGKLGDPEAAERLIASGDADLAAIGTSALANPDWVNRVKEGRTLNPFDHQFLHPIATIKEEELL